MGDESSRGWYFGDIRKWRMRRNWERGYDMGFLGERKEEGGFESGREAGRKGMGVRGPDLKGKGIGTSQDGRGWAWPG
jgi:hypothetical protein